MIRRSLACTAFQTPLFPDTSTPMQNPATATQNPGWLLQGGSEAETRRIDQLADANLQQHSLWPLSSRSSAAYPS